MAVMIRVAEQTRDAVLEVARRDFGGATADQTLRALLDEHRVARAIAHMDEVRTHDAAGWADYVTEAAELDGASPAPDPAL